MSTALRHMGVRSAGVIEDATREMVLNPGVERLAGGQGLRDLGIDLLPRIGTVVREFSLVAPTQLTVQGLVPPATVTVNTKIPLSPSPGVYQVAPGRAVVEVQLLTEQGTVRQVRRASVTFVEGENAIVTLSEMPLAGAQQGWSTGQKTAVALGAAVVTAGIVYAVASRR